MRLSVKMLNASGKISYAKTLAPGLALAEINENIPEFEPISRINFDFWESFIKLSIAISSSLVELSH